MKDTLRDVRQSIEYAAAKTALAMAGTLPLGAAMGVGAAIGRVAFDLARVRRDVSVDNVTRALGVPRREAARIARGSYANLGRSLMEFAAFRHLTPADLREMVEFEGVEHLEEARAAGRGAVIVAGHLDNWELLGLAPALYGFPLDFLIGQQSNRRVDDVINALRRRQGVGIIPRAFGLRGVMQSLAAGRFVALLADQDARRGGVVVEFLGRPASTVRGPAVFAIRRKSPLIPMFMHRERGPGKRRHRGIFEAAMFPDPALDEEAAVQDLTQRYTARLTAHVREHPTEYFWPHRRWKSASTQR